MNRLSQYFKKHGFATMKELKAVGFQTRDVRALVDNETIAKIKPGLYKQADLDIDDSSLIEVCKAVPKGVICLVSALEYHELSTINPNQIHISIPHSKKSVPIIYPPTIFYFFRESHYVLGIDEIPTKYGNIKIYNAEKTICDMFRYRNKLGEDLALEGLKNYLKRNDAKINKLWEYAVKCRVKTILHPYIKAMVVE